MGVRGLGEGEWGGERRRRDGEGRKIDVGRFVGGREVVLQGCGD